MTLQYHTLYCMALYCNIHLEIRRQGNQDLYEQSVPMLEVMGKAHFFLGEVGKGAEMKLVCNMVRAN